MKPMIALNAAVFLLLVGCGCARKEAEVAAPTSSIIRLDAALDELVSTTAPIEKIAGGHEITEISAKFTDMQ